MRNHFAAASYSRLVELGELTRRKEAAWKRLQTCDLCAHECGVNRRVGEKGICQADDTVQISGCGPHFGEEDVLVGSYGSGTIFFSGCNMKCVFCQNWDISHLRVGQTVSVPQLAQIMLDLAEQNCHNINLVTPTHFLPQILSALEIAAGKGLKLPLVYNCGGYESITALRLLDGIVDIYMPDVKFADPVVGLKLAKAKDYPRVVKAALKEMYQQVGDLIINREGIAERGLIIRHLVLPGGLAGTGEILSFVAREISVNTYLNIMSQYYPAYKSKEHPPLNREIRVSEYQEAIKLARRLGFHRLA